MKIIKILALRSNPTNTAALRLDEEIRGIKDELERARYRDRFEFISQGAVRADDLSRALLRHKPDIVHFSGHGAGEHGLVLEDNSGTIQLISTEALNRLFRWGRSTIKCVFLNACYSKVQAKGIHQYIDCVIGMNKVIGDWTAIKFAAKFYQALVEGESFQSAYEYACTALDLSGSNPDWQAALTALGQLKQVIRATAELDETEKEMVEVPIKKLEAELQKPQPDKNVVDRTITALKKALDGILTLAEPMAKVAALIANAWVG